MTIEWHQLALYVLAYFVTVATPGPFIAAIAARSAPVTPRRDIAVRCARTTLIRSLAAWRLRKTSAELVNMDAIITEKHGETTTMAGRLQGA